jgi:NitT/TauT family transport system substrate-binding protein
MKATTKLSAILLAAGIGLASFAGGAVAADKVTIALPGVPPAYVAVLFYVTRDAGFFQKYGIDAELKQLDSGTAAAQAVSAGSFDLSLSPTPTVINMVSNAGVPLVSIFGMENPDWVLGTTDPKFKKCEDVKGQSIGVDTLGGARSVALGEFLRACNLKFTDVKQAALGTSVGPSMIAGQISLGVLHTDDLANIAKQMGKPVTIVQKFKDVNPLSHYMSVVTTKDRLKAKREDFVKVVAALHDAIIFMNDSKNLDKVAQIAKVTGAEIDVTKPSLEQFLKIEFWPVDKDGLNRKNIETAIATEKTSGNIKADKTPVTYDQLVDTSLYTDAKKIEKK